MENVLERAFHFVFYINYDEILLKLHMDRKSWGPQMNKLAMKLISSNKQIVITWEVNGCFGLNQRAITQNFPRYESHILKVLVLTEKIWFKNHIKNKFRKISFYRPRTFQVKNLRFDALIRRIGNSLLDFWGIFLIIIFVTSTTISHNGNFESFW